MRRAALAALLVVSASAARARAESEWNVVPLAGGDSDVGYGAGAFGNVARTAPGYEPYVWNLDLATLLTVKVHSPGGVETPYEDLYGKLTVPKLTRALRLEVHLAYTRESTAEYYGVGDATIDAPPARLAGDANAQRHYFEFDRVHPTLTVTTRTALGGPFFAIAGTQFTYNQVTAYPDSKLAEDLRASGEPLHAHGVMLFEYALHFDDRDNEVVPTRGMFHQIKLRFSPGGVAAAALPYRYESLNATLRAYVPLAGKDVVFATRVVGDALFGDPPFYELGRYEETYAIGGVNGVRGVPAARYFGRLKAFGNFELRTHLFDAHAFGRPLPIDGVVFVDAGRVWSEVFRARPDLDGAGLGLKYGVGGGLRARSGSTFVVRGDVAWSPDAHPIGGYFTAGETF